MRLEEKIVELLKDEMCDSCLGRQFANLLSGYTNEHRGKILRQYSAFLLDSGEKLDVNLNNFHGMKFRNADIRPEKPEKCKICKNFFQEKLSKLAEKVADKLNDIEFRTFLGGSIPSHEMLNAEEKIHDKIGIDFTETIRSEINRELGKIVERLTKASFSLKNPDVTILVDLNTNTIRLQIRSLYIYGRYQKLSRNMPQTKWVCRQCGGKGCTFCKGEGKLYKTSVQEIIEKPLLKATRSRSSSFSGAGREDIDARCLDYRPFVIEMMKPVKRKIDLRMIEKEINKSKKVKVRSLKLLSDGKHFIRKLKTERIDKTYAVEVEFKKAVDKNKLKLVKSITNEPILQKTPIRVVHRRADKFRKRRVKSVSFKQLGGKKVLFKIRSEAGLYIKELITGDGGRTTPNISDVLNNSVKKIKLDVIKIWTGKG